MKKLPLLLFVCAALGAPLFAADAKKNVLMIAGRPSHGPGDHEHNAGIQLLAKCLQQGAADRVDVKFHLNAEWPSADELAKADCVVVLTDHSCFDVGRIVRGAKLVVDTRNVTRGLDAQFRDRVLKLGAPAPDRKSTRLNSSHRT